MVTTWRATPQHVQQVVNFLTADQEQIYIKLDDNMVTSSMSTVAERAQNTLQHTKTQAHAETILTITKRSNEEI